MLTVNTNMAALRAQNAMRLASASLERSMERLSTGKRINRASDDPAGLAIAGNMGSQIAGMGQAIRNANDGISRAQTAEGILGEVVNMAQRIRELALNAASGTFSGQDRAAMNSEVMQLTAQIGKTLGDATFNGSPLFDTTAAGGGAGTPGTPGYGTSTSIQVGPNAGHQSNLTIENLDTTAILAVSVGTAGDASNALTTLDAFMNKLSNARATLGGQQSGLTATIDALNTSIVSMSEARSRIMDVDYGAESTALAKAQIMLQSATAMLSQANQMTKSLVRMLIEP